MQQMHTISLRFQRFVVARQHPLSGNGELRHRGFDAREDLRFVRRIQRDVAQIEDEA